MQSHLTKEEEVSNRSATCRMQRKLFFLKTFQLNMYLLIKYHEQGTCMQF